MNHLTSAPDRIDYLDAVRAFALLLGIVFHASLSFLPIFIGWAVMDISTSPLVSLFALISHSFRMALFFLIAGYFSRMTFQSRGAAGFIKSRLVRIAIPFILGWVILRPLLVSGWIIGAESMRGDAHILNGIQAGFATLGELPKDLLVGTHLWFLYYLLLITGSVLALRYLVNRNAIIQMKSVQMTDSLAQWFSQSHFATVLLALPTAACLWFMSHWGVDTPDKSLLPIVPVFLIYGGAFLFGWLLQRQPHFIEQFARLTWGRASLCVAAIVVTVLLAGFETQLAHPHYQLFKAGSALAYAVMMWSLISLTIALFKLMIRRTNRVLRYLADASYWLYLIHLPIVIWLQIAFAELALHWSLKLAAISGLTVLIALVLYEFLIRATFVGAVLNGKRKPRLLFSGADKQKTSDPLKT